MPLKSRSDQRARDKIMEDIIEMYVKIGRSQEKDLKQIKRGRSRFTQKQYKEMLSDLTELHKPFKNEKTKHSLSDAMAVKRKLKVFMIKWSM